MAPILLVTSTGRASRHVISMLLSLPDCPAIRIIARSDFDIQESMPGPLRSAPHSIFVADHYQGREFEAAFQGVSIVFHNGPALHAHEKAMSIAVIDTAKEAGVKHFVLCSVFDPIRTKIQTHQVKLAIEEYLVESRLNYTILQPTHYMQNISLENALRSRVVPIAFSPSVVHGFIDLFDLATVARNIILFPAQHNLARYELIGQNKSYNDISRTLTRISHIVVQCDVISPKEIVARMKAVGEIQNEFAEHAIERLMLYYDRWGLAGNSNILRWLLGREPTTWEGYVTREIQKF